MEAYLSIPKRPKKCCIPNCKNWPGRRHRFPKRNPEVFEKWVTIIKPPNYEYLTMSQIYDKYYICDEHFTPECFVPGSKRGLTFNAVPTLHLPFHSGQEDANTFQQLTTPAEAQQTCSLGPQKRVPILRHPNITREVDLTPKARALYRMVKKYSSKMSGARFTIKSYRARLAKAEELAKSEFFENILGHVNNVAYNFVISQVHNQKLLPKARRYSVEQKMLALSVLKASGRGYQLLSKMFALPSARTLSNLMNKFPLRPGVNQHIFKSLRSSILKMKQQDKVCILMFDEIAVEAALSYNKKEDAIIGLQDLGYERQASFANHANVFMLRGLNKQWKQPLTFTFSDGPIESDRLLKMIKEIIIECQEIGLKIVATVCDQSAANQAAVNKLLLETKQKAAVEGAECRRFGFIIGNQEVVPLFDVPHLFKGLRNNLLTKDLHFTLNDKHKIGKWEHLEKLYQLDAAEPSLRLCSKLTDAHIIKEKINKMKVSHCTQVFSYTVGALMKRISRWYFNDSHILPPEAVDTADLILFLDQLFDSLNGSNRGAPSSKPLKGALTKSSLHEEFWRESLKTLKSMKFFCDQKKLLVQVPSIKNLCFTIEGFLYLKTSCWIKNILLT